jgi:hypothetical protein
MRAFNTCTHSSIPRSQCTYCIDLDHGRRAIIEATEEAGLVEDCVGDVMYKAKVELNKLDPYISRGQSSKRSLGSLATVGRQIQ